MADPKLYCSNGSVSKLVTKLYCGVNYTQQIWRADFLTGGDIDAFISAANTYDSTSVFKRTLINTYPYLLSIKISSTSLYLRIGKTSDGGFYSKYLIFKTPAVLANFLRDAGFTFVSGQTADTFAAYLFSIATLNLTVPIMRFGVGEVSRQVTKLYAGVGGVAKLVYAA